MNNFGITTGKYYLDYACMDTKVHFRDNGWKLIWPC